jgi:hypothetical protein
MYAKLSGGDLTTLTVMARLALVGVAIAVLFALAACGGQTTYTPEKTKTCLTQRGAHVSGNLDDFVAQTATGGAFVTKLGDNFVVIAFGQTLADGKQIELAYQRFAYSNVRSGLPDVVRRYNNVVTRWHAHPNDSDLSLIVGCLR